MRKARRTAAQGSSGSKVALSKVGQASEAPAGAAQAAEKQEAQVVAGDCDDKKGRGAPKKDVLKMEASLWTEFGTADAHSLYFCENSDVQKRLVVRWCNTCRTKASSSSGEVRASYERAGKRLQITESCISIHRQWVHRSSDIVKAHAEFESSWAILEAFARSEPEQLIQCDFIWNLRYELKACHMSKVLPVRVRRIGTV